MSFSVNKCNNDDYINKWQLVNEIIMGMPLDFNVEMFIYWYESRIVYAK